MLVYIAEAHAADVWPINSSRNAGPANTVFAPTSLGERRAVARRMLDALPWLRDVDILVDGLDDRFLVEYAAWPVRTYGISAGVVEHIGDPIGPSIDILPAQRWLAGKLADEAR